MSRRINSPVGKGKESIKLIEDGDLKAYFLLKGYATPLTNPEEIQVLERQEEEITEIIFRTIDRRASSQNITREEARTEYYGTTLPDGTQVAPTRNIDDDLLPKENARLVTLSKEVTPRLKLLTATNLMQSRLLYQLEPIKKASSGEERLYVKKPWFAIFKGDKFEFDNHVIAVKDITDSEIALDGNLKEQCKCLTIDRLTFSIHTVDTGFLLKKDRQEKETGDSEWTLEDTKDKLPAAFRSTDPPRFIDKLWSAYREDIAGISSKKERFESDENFITDGETSENISPQVLQTTESLN